MKALKGLSCLQLSTQWNHAPLQKWIVTMTDDETPVTFSNSDYDAIEAAVMETARGRWFLHEYAKRNRNADTEVVLAALGRLEKAVLDDETARTMDLIRANLQNMATTITQTKGEIGLIQREGDDLNSFVDAVSQAAGPDAEHEFQAMAEQRIRRMLQTLRYLEGRIHEMIAICDPEQTSADQERSFPEPSQMVDEHVIHPGPHPSFLM
jgi:uncharacterized protein YukE